MYVFAFKFKFNLHAPLQHIFEECLSMLWKKKHRTSLKYTQCTGTRWWASFTIYNIHKYLKRKEIYNKNV